jgi:N-acyl-L-homoserine lactone synthetase
MTRPASVRIESVTLCAGCAWHDEYRRLRHRVFVVEQGWTSLISAGEPGLTRDDPADAGAWFWLARTADGALVGGVRVRPVAGLFPHQELFAHHLRRPEVAAALPGLGTLNSLLVDHAWRGRVCEGPGGEWATVASHLLGAGLAGGAARGLSAIVATAQTVISARALMRAGFHVVDPPVATSLHARFPMCNVAVALNGWREQAALHAYFRGRECEILRHRTIDGWFESAAARAGAA